MNGAERGVPGGEHAVRFIGATRNQVIHQHTDVAFITARPTDNQKRIRGWVRGRVSGWMRGVDRVRHSGAL